MPEPDPESREAIIAAMQAEFDALHADMYDHKKYPGSV